jgi:hypothetical protein
MEMPCLCDCGEWFDLNDGYSIRGSNKVVCYECHKADKKAEENAEALYMIGTDLDEGHITFSQAKTMIKKKFINTSKLRTKDSLVEFCINFNK